MSCLKPALYHSALGAVYDMTGVSTAGGFMLFCLEQKYTFGHFHTVKGHQSIRDVAVHYRIKCCNLPFFAASAFSQSALSTSTSVSIPTDGAVICAPCAGRKREREGFFSFSRRREEVGKSEKLLSEMFH